MVRRNPLARSLVLGGAVGSAIGLGIILILAINYAYLPGLVLVCPGCGQHEALNNEGARFNSPTNVTLSIRNTGSQSVQFIAYYVKDGAGNTFAEANWSGPTFAPNTVVTVNILIDGRAFVFYSGGYSYSIEIVTARNTQFTFTVTDQ